MIKMAKIFCVVLLGVLVSTESASAAIGEAEFLEHYKAGLTAIDAENWQRAADLMRRAIADRGKESRRLPKYLYLKPYLPFFYLGLADFKRGNCKAALESWSVSERQGVVQKRPQYQQIELARELCRSRKRPLESNQTELRAPHSSSLSPAAPRPKESQSPTPAEPRSREPQSPLPAQPRSRESLAPPPLRRSEPAAPRSIPQPPSPRSVPPDEDSPSSRSVPPDEHSFAARRLMGPPEPPADYLLEAATALIDGSYQLVVDQLSTRSSSDAYSQAHVHLLLAAAELALYLKSGERDTGRLENARQHVLEVRATLPDLEPPERYFSPRFLDFFYGQRLQEER